MRRITSFKWDKKHPKCQVKQKQPRIVNVTEPLLKFRFDDDSYKVGIAQIQNMNEDEFKTGCLCRSWYLFIDDVCCIEFGKVTGWITIWWTCARASEKLPVKNTKNATKLSNGGKKQYYWKILSPNILWIKNIQFITGWSLVTIMKRRKKDLTVPSAPGTVSMQPNANLLWHARAAS